MNKKIFILFFLCLVIIVFSCGKDNPMSPSQSKPATVSAGQGSVAKKGAVQISGVSFFDAADACDVASEGATFSLNMTGDLTGCLYTFVDEFECSPSGTYREIGREHFVGTYNGQEGSFWTNYKFEAKYEGCAADGSYLGAEIKGRCQHPIDETRGSGVFEGVTGRLDMKDDIEAGNYLTQGTSISNITFFSH
jgi:hypothetical protein